MSTGALRGIRVIDFTWVVAGPVATRILADNGAEVIKVERKIPGLKVERRIGLQGDLNRNKLSVAINMSEPRGIALAQRLVGLGDIVIDNFSARVMKQWGMDYQTLSRHKPDIICISMSGLGHTGPRSSYVSYGPTLQALSGFTLLMADADGQPAGYGYSYADMAGGYTGALAALMALWHRRRTGKGQFVDLSQFEAICALVGPGLLDIAVNQRTQTPPQYDSQEAPSAPHGVYRCRPLGDDQDRWLALAVGSHVEWRRFVVALGSPQWASDPRFATLYQRRRNREALDSHITAWTLEHDAHEAMNLLQQAGIAAGVVSNGADLCERDAQLRARGFFPDVRLPDGRITKLSSMPFRLSAIPPAPSRVSPDVGDDSDYVLGTLLGLSKAEREELIAAKAIWP